MRSLLKLFVILIGLSCCNLHGTSIKSSLIISMALILRMVSDPTPERLRAISVSIINFLPLYTSSIISQISEQAITAIQNQQSEAQFTVALKQSMIENQQLSTGASVAQSAVSGRECLSLNLVSVEQHAAMEPAASQGINIPLTIEIPAVITLSDNNHLTMSTHGNTTLLSEAVYGQIAAHYDLHQDQGASASLK